MEPTKTQVTKAGKILRAIAQGEDVDFDTAKAALDVMLRFRAGHRLPLIKGTMGLRSRVKTAGCHQMEVSQRLKRARTIVEKLGKHPTLALANMQDVGGCRAVVETIPALRRVQRRFNKERTPRRVDDYIEAPKASGYRGVHLIVVYDEHQIEVQLRTPVMHEWAISVERLGNALGEDLKSGLGPKPILDLLAAVSEASAVEERGEVVDTGLVTEIQRLRADAVRHVHRSP